MQVSGESEPHENTVDIAVKVGDDGEEEAEAVAAAVGGSEVEFAGFAAANTAEGC